VEPVRIVVPPGVFRPRSDTWLLAGAIRNEELPRDASVLDLCTGNGVLAVTAGLAGAGQVTAVDISRLAVATAWLNGRLNGVAVESCRGDLFSPLAGRSFDAIVSNPPYVPAPGGGLPRRGPRRAWEAGSDGRALLDRIVAEAPEHLRPGGFMLLVQSSVSGVQPTLEGLQDRGLVVSVVASARGPLGPILAESAEELEARGALRPGRREEDLVVIRAAE
jgi:release factor glutamine methyltransferase